MICDKIFFVVVILSFNGVLGLQQEFIRLASNQCDPSVQDCIGGTCYKTLSGCLCKDRWQFEGKQYSGCQNPDNSPEGNWCEFMPGTCESKSHSKFYEHCHQDCKTDLLVAPLPNFSQVAASPSPQDAVASEGTTVVSDDSCGDFLDNIDYAGNDLKLKVQNEIDCQRICRLTIDCKFFSYGKSNNGCYLKPAPLNLVEKADFVSAPACS